MKIKKRRYIQFVLALVASAIVASTLLVNSPRVQQRVSVILATELENRIGTRVNLGGVHWLFPNDIVIDSLTIDDQEGEHLLSVNRVAAKIEWLPLILKRQLSIRNVRLFHPGIHLYRTDAASDYNYQFLIDAFASKKEKREPSRLSLHINTLLVRHAHLCHIVGRTAERDSTTLNLNNLAIDDFSAQVSLKTLSADSLSVIVRHLGFEEKSGLCVDDLYLRLVANRHGATLANFQLRMPHSTLRLDTIWASYSAGNFKESFIAKGRILPSHITPNDLAWLIPQTKEFTEKVHLSANVIGSASRLNIKEFDLHTQHRDIALRANAVASFTGNKLRASDIELQEMTLTATAWPLLEKGLPDIYNLIPVVIPRIGAITANGYAKLKETQSTIDLKVASDAGDLKAHMKIDDKGHYTTSVDGQGIKVEQLVPSSPLTYTNLALEAAGVYNYWQPDGELPLQGTFKGKATQTHLLGYSYQSISLDGQYGPDAYSGRVWLDDPNGELALQAEYNSSGELPHYHLDLYADSLNLHAMRLLDIHEGNRFSAQLNADIQGPDFNHFTGQICIDSLTLHKPEEDYTIKKIALYASDPEAKMLSLDSDFMHATVRGMFTYSSLLNSILGHLHHSLPSLCQSHDHTTTDNLCLINAEIRNTTPLRELLLMPIETIGHAQFDAIINDLAGELTLTATVPQVNYDGHLLKGISLDCQSKEGGASLYAGATLHDEDSPTLTASLTTKAAGDKVDLSAVWNSNPTNMFEGTFHTQAAFALDNHNKLTATIETDSTSAILNHSEWRLDPFSMKIAPEHILINGLHLTNGTAQHLSAEGAIADSETDTLQVSFTGLDLGYLLSLVKLEGISFDGKANGNASIARLYSEQPYIDADISAQDFTFCDGPMGDMSGHLHWNQDASQLQFTADIWESPRHTTVVDGIVDLKRNELWLDIAADSTNISFLNSMLGSFMADISGNASGQLIVGGPMDALDLDGALLTDASFNLTPTNANYHFKDSLRFTPGVIHLDGIEVFDHREQKGIVKGDITHSKLQDYAYDLYVDVQNILGIDIPDTGHDSFYTTIYGTGDIQIKGSPTTPLDIDIQAQSEKGSIFALNLASQSESSSDAFITFTDRSSTRNVPTAATRTSGRGQRRNRVSSEISPSTEIDITAHVTPSATLKLVMDQSVDDHISATGNGDLQIRIHGDDISLFGTYTVDRGFYRLNLQDVINKSFDVLSGSTVSFEGDPMAARLDITARHAVNYVPLRDLSRDMTGNVHVNCLLRIGGTLNAPSVTFDLELPQGTEEEKAVLASYTNTAEQMNQQFIYLLGLGKFYTPDMAQNTQGTTGNVESFISSTISGQINNLLAGIISNDNWNLASNLRAENMMTGESDLDGENWDNMEIEGILEGRLLDNRLLINGSFGYRNNPMYASNLIGDFDIRYLLTGGLSLKGYNRTNNRYFSKTSLTTQGLGVVFQHDFDRLFPPLRRKREDILTTDTLSTRKP